MINKKEFGDWAVVFWKKGSKTLHIAQNQGDLGTTNYWMVGTTTRQFDYESGWLPNKEWTSAIKGHFSKDKAIQLAKENAEKSLNESKYVDKDIEPLGKKLSHHSDDGFIDFCTAKVLDDLNKGDKKKLDFYEFWDWAAEVGSKDIVELIYHDFKNDKLAKDSSVNKFYNIYADIKDLSLKDPKKFVKMYGWAYEDKIKDKSLKECLMKENKGLKEGHLDHIKDKWQSELDKGVEPKILMDPWAVCEGMKWLGKDGWIRVEEVLTPTEYEEPYPDFYMEIFDQHTCVISHDIYTINEINSYVRDTKARLVNNGIKNLVNESKLKESESGLCPRDAYNKRQREIDRENDATLAYGRIDDAMSSEFMKDSFFKKAPGSHHWSESVGDFTFVCSVDTDNYCNVHFSTYDDNRKRLDSKYVHLNGDCVEQFYNYIEDRLKYFEDN